ncbi:MAG: hypothetical protein WA708_00065 [Acidobacteriaceae bacterium]
MRLETSEGNFQYKITHALGAAMVACGTAIPLIIMRGASKEIVGYRLTPPAKASNSQASAAVITPAEVLAVAGVKFRCGKSRTARLPEWDTNLRDSKHARELANDPKLPVEDFVERSQIKVRWWLRVPLTNPRHEAWAG